MPYPRAQRANLAGNGKGDARCGGWGLAAWHRDSSVAVVAGRHSARPTVHGGAGGIPEGGAGLAFIYFEKELAFRFLFFGNLSFDFKNERTQISIFKFQEPGYRFLFKKGTRVSIISLKSFKVMFGNE